MNTNVMSGTRKTRAFEELAHVVQLAQQVASSCGFDFVPPIRLRRGKGGDWNPTIRCVRIGRGELEGGHDHLWYIVAHELSHAQADLREGHTRAFCVRLANGLADAGKIEFLRYRFGYRETAICVAEEYSLPDVPKRRNFRLAVGYTVDDTSGRHWKIDRRFRQAGEPYYRLKTRGWRWVTSEIKFLSEHTNNRG